MIRTNQQTQRLSICNLSATLGNRGLIADLLLHRGVATILTRPNASSRSVSSVSSASLCPWASSSSPPTHRHCCPRWIRLEAAASNQASTTATPSLPPRPARPRSSRAGPRPSAPTWVEAAARSAGLHLAQAGWARVLAREGGDRRLRRMGRIRRRQCPYPPSLHSSTTPRAASCPRLSCTKT